MLQNHVGVAYISESMFAAEEQAPGLDKCQDFVLDLKVATSLQRVTKILSARISSVTEKQKMVFTYRSLEN